MKKVKRNKHNGTQMNADERRNCRINVSYYFYFNKNYNLKNLCISALICVLIIFMVSVPSFGGEIESIHIIKISPQDERAIVRTPDGKMWIVKVGDVIGMNAKVVEITTGRIVLEERTEFGKETVIIRVKGKKQRVERIRKAGEKQPMLYAPNWDREKK